MPRRKIKKHNYKDLSEGILAPKSLAKKDKLAEEVDSTDLTEDTHSKCDDPEASGDSLDTLQKEERSLKIQIQQAKNAALKNELHSLNTTPMATSQVEPLQSSENSKLPNTTSLAMERDLEAALGVLEAAHMKDYLNPEEPISGSKEQAPKHSKYDTLHITDFVTTPGSSAGREKEKEISKGVWLKVDSKLKTDEVSVPQWLSANVRILLAMMDSMSYEAVKEYLRYTGKVGDLLQRSTDASVMILDEEHRKQVSREGVRWDQIDGDNKYFYLKVDPSKDPDLKNTTKPTAQSKPNKLPSPLDKSGKPICGLFNKPKGCYRYVCNFSHVCSIPGCAEDHPSFLHNTPPRFRGHGNGSKQE